MSLALLDRPTTTLVRSVDRALDLLKALERARSPMGVSELGRSAGIPKATAQRLLAALELRGFVEKERGRYQLGAAVVALADAFLAGNSLTRASLPVLEELVASTGETASLYVRQGFDRVVVQRVHSPHPLRYILRIGQRLPLHLGASGQLLSAAMDEDELLRYLDRIGEIRLATGERLSKPDFLAKLARARERGFALSFGERDSGVVSVAAPVLREREHARGVDVPSGMFTVHGGTVAAVGVTGPRVRMTPEKVDQVIQAVRRAADQIADSHGRW